MMVYSIEIIHFIRNVFFVPIVLNLCEMNVMLNMLNKRIVRNVQKDYSDDRQKNDGFYYSHQTGAIGVFCFEYCQGENIYRERITMRFIRRVMDRVCVCVFKIEMMRVEKVLIDEDDDDDFED